MNKRKNTHTITGPKENALKNIAQLDLADTIAYSELNKWSYVIPSWQADRFLEGLKVIEGGLQ